MAEAVPTLRRDGHSQGKVSAGIRGSDHRVSRLAGLERVELEWARADERRV